MGDNLDDISKKLNKVKKELPKQVLPKIEPLMKLSLNRAVQDFYDSYTPKMYDRTNNFKSITNNPEIQINKKSIIMTVSSDSMSDYPGVYSPLEASTAFKYFYQNGEHGHGMWLAAVSTPPDMLVEDDVLDGFGGQVDVLIDQVMNQIMN